MSEECKHDLADRETMCADGYCPTCLLARINELEENREGYGRLLESANNDVENLQKWSKDLQAQLAKHRPLEDELLAALEKIAKLSVYGQGCKKERIAEQAIASAKEQNK